MSLALSIVLLLLGLGAGTAYYGYVWYGWPGAGQLNRVKTHQRKIRRSAAPSNRW